MERIPKFRGKKTSTGEWVYGSLIFNTNGSHTICQIRHSPVHNGSIEGWCFGVDPETVGEFTGLQDKNGKDIYEGDVVDFDNRYNGLVTVVWIKKFASFALIRKGWVFPHYFGEACNGEDVGVIGNIYDS